MWGAILPAPPLPPTATVHPGPFPQVRQDHRVVLLMLPDPLWDQTRAETLSSLPTSLAASLCPTEHLAGPDPSLGLCL